MGRKVCMHALHTQKGMGGVVTGRKGRYAHRRCGGQIVGEYITDGPWFIGKGSVGVQRENGRIGC